MKILFVGTDNKTRSVMAEFMMRDMIKESQFEGEIMCLSAGIASNHGENIDRTTSEVLSEMGIETSDFKAKKLSERDVQMWDVFFVMTQTHAYILEKAGVPQYQIYSPNQNIMDVSGEGIEKFRECRDIVFEEIKIFYEKLKATL